jgi:hypothetical protein
MIDVNRKIEEAVRGKFEKYFDSPHIRLISGSLDNNPELHIYESIMQNANQALSSDDSQISLAIYADNMFKTYTAQRRYITDPIRQINAVWLNVDRVNRYVAVDVLDYCKLTDTLVTDFLLADF